MSWRTPRAGLPRRAPGRRHAVLIALLGAIFLKGFTEAIGIAVGLVAVYLAFNLVVVTVALEHLVANPGLVVDWRQLLTTSYSSRWPWSRSP
jgi:hypothetical protein